MKMLRLGIAALFLAGGLSYGEEKSPDQWAAALGSEDPAIRQQAEIELKDAAVVLVPLSRHADPWVATRAERLLMELRGIDTRIPRRLRQEVYDFEELPELRQIEVLNELTQAGPGNLNALAFIYNRGTAGRNLPANESRLWQQRFQSCIRVNRNDVESLRPEILTLPARAFLLSCFPDVTDEKHKERYEKWRAIDPTIRERLKEGSVTLEIEHLRQHADTSALLVYLSLIVSPDAQREAAELISKIVSKDRAFNADGLGEAAAIGHLIMLVHSGGIQRAMPWYEKHIAAHPGIAAKLPESLALLEVHRMLNEGGISRAIALVLKPRPDSERSARIDWNTLGEISKLLGTKPETLPDGLPAIADPQALRAMGEFLKAWFPMSRPSPSYPDVEAKVECFDRWAKSAEWLDAARRFGPQPLYHLVMARRGKIGEAIAIHESELEEFALKNLGALLLLKPEIQKQIPARQCAPATLRTILDGGLSGPDPDMPLPGPLPDLATEWSGFQPNLLAPGSFPTQPLYQAAITWRKGGFNEAAALLLACTKPIPYDSASGQSPPPKLRPNPLSSPAILLFARLLAENSAADVHALLPPGEVSRETLQTLLDCLLRMDGRKPGQVRAAMALSKLLRDRFDVTEPKPLFHAYEARGLALDAWMAGDAKLAGDFLIQGYLTAADDEEQHDTVLAPAMKLLGRAEDALTQLDANETTLPTAVRASKRGRLLRELGRTKEAMACVSPDHHPALRQRLAVETGAWDTAIRSTLDLKQDPKKRDAMTACIAVFSGDPELMNRQRSGKHPVLNLLKGNGIRDDDLAAMARDAELLSRLEARLTAALASGEPIRAIDMSGYFQHLDLLPDKRRAALLAVELAKRDFCVFADASSGEKLTGHKVLAAETLLLLGRGELAFAAMRPLMEASIEPHDFKQAEGGIVSGGQIRAVVAGYRQATRIAHFEWPDNTPAGCMAKLGAILEQNDPLARARGMIGLISKHEAKLETNDLLQALHLPFLDLAHAGDVPEDLKESTRSLLQKRQPRPQETQWLKAQWARVPWTAETSHPPDKGTPGIKVTHKPQAGPKFDPKKPDFVIIDGLAAASQLQQQGNYEAARALLRDVVMRVLLDSKIVRQEVEWYRELRDPAGSSSSGFDTEGLLTILCYFDLLDVPANLVVDITDACANPWTNYSDAMRLYHAARVLDKAGDHPLALAYYRRFIIATMPAIGSEDVGSCGRDEIADMQRVRGTIAAKTGDSASAVDAVLQLVQISPYQPQRAKDIAAILTAQRDARTIQSARAAIDGFWRIRLLEIPASETYRYWKTEWERLFP